MADLRARYLEDYAGGILNIARQELSANGEVLAQDGLLDGATLYVEDGTGTKSGLRLGNNLVEVVDPTTETGIVNVRFADRTCAKIEDLKTFTVAISSTQAALAESTAVSIENAEIAVQLLENDLTTSAQELSRTTRDNQETIASLELFKNETELALVKGESEIKTLQNEFVVLNKTVLDFEETLAELTAAVDILLEESQRRPG